MEAYQPTKIEHKLETIAPLYKSYINKSKHKSYKSYNT